MKIGFSLGPTMNFPVFFQQLHRRPVNKREVAVLFRQLAVMLGAGLTLVHSLHVLKGQAARPYLRDILSGIVRDLERGLSFEKAVAASKGRFPVLSIHLIRAGEKAGILADVLLRLSDYLADEDQMTSKMTGTLIYPAIVLVFAVVSILFIAVYIMPVFSELYSTAGISLPLLTRSMMGLALVLQKYPLHIVLLLVTALLSARYAAGHQRGRLWLDRFLIRIPLVGRICIDIDLMRFTQIMSVLLKAGVTVSDAIETAAGVLGNSYLAIAMEDTHASILKGDSIASALARHPVFPNLLVQMVAVGEESGSLALLFRQLSEYIRRDLLNRVNRLTAALEPVLVLMVALVVGSVVLATLVPVYGIIGLTTGMQ